MNYNETDQITDEEINSFHGLYIHGRSKNEEGNDVTCKLTHNKTEESLICHNNIVFNIIILMGIYIMHAWLIKRKLTNDSDDEAYASHMKN